MRSLRPVAQEPHRLPRIGDARHQGQQRRDPEGEIGDRLQPGAATRGQGQARLADLILRHMILVDEDGLATTPPVRPIDDEEFGGGDLR